MKSAYVRGFTIVELIVVIVVVAILAGISIVAYKGITDDARASATASELKSLKKAGETFTAKHGGKFPHSLNEVASMGVSTGAGSGISWEFDSYYGMYRKRGDGTVQGEYRIFSVAEYFHIIYYDYKDKMWKVNLVSTVSGGYDQVNSLNCSANLLDDCLSP